MIRHTYDADDGQKKTSSSGKTHHKRKTKRKCADNDGIGLIDSQIADVV